MARHVSRAVTRAGLLLAAVAVTASACSGGGGSGRSSGGGANASAPANSASSSSSSSAAPAAAMSEIRQNRAAFFNGKTTPQKKIELLQNGTKCAPVIKKQSKSRLARSTKAKVSNVALTGPQRATVTYSVLIGGKPAVTHQTGHAIRTAGAGKVTDASFCQLLGLQGRTPPMCPAGASSAAASPTH
jgi:hypothetical protein